MDGDSPRAAGQPPSFPDMADALGLGMAFQIVASPDGAQRRFTYVGRFCRQMTGLAPEAVRRDPPLLWDRIAPEDRARLDRAWAAAMATLSGFEIEVRMRRADGEARRRIVSTPTPLEDGWVVWDGLVMEAGEARSAALAQQNLLLGELAHRAKNGIQVMMAIVAHTARGVASVREFEDVLTARLQAMAVSQDLVTASGGRPVPLTDVIAKTLNPFDAGRFDVDGALAGLIIGGDVAVALGLLLHELSTNAVKYGSLSVPAGRVDIARVEGPHGHATLHWAERGGPRVRPASRKGFGSRLLEVGLRAQGGQVEAAFDPEGFRARIGFPVERPPGFRPDDQSVM